ncbi:RNA polymerase subunit sigma-24, partial [Streptomyces parvus]
ARGTYPVPRSDTGARAGAAPRDGVVMTVASFDIADGRVTRIWAVRNPEKLRPWARHDDRT